AERVERLVGGEARAAERRDLEQDARGLAEVDRLEVEAVDDRRRLAARIDHPVVPGFLLVRLAWPRDVVDGARAGHPGRLRRVVVDVEAAALVAAALPARLE